MKLEETPGLSERERGSIRAYEEAHEAHAAAAMETMFGFPEETGGADGGGPGYSLGRAVAEIEGAYARLAEIAPAGRPGREGGVSYAELLSALRERGLGERDAVRPGEPGVPWGELPPARLLVFSCLDLMHYGFVARPGGALDHAPGHESCGLLYDVPEQMRAELGEDGVVGAHGDRHELEMRLWRVLERAADDSEGERREGLRGLGFDCGYDARVFYSSYADEPDYVGGFVDGCLERIREGEEGDEEERGEVTADHLEDLWREEGLSEEDKHEMVVEVLLSECEVSEGEGEMWRL